MASGNRGAVQGCDPESSRLELFAAVLRDVHAAVLGDALDGSVTVRNTNAL